MLTTIPCNPAEVKVVLLKGGKSGEREISLKSGAACANALREEGFDVTEIDTAEEGMLTQIINAAPDVIFITLHGKDGEDGCVQGFCELLGVPYTGPGVLASALAMDKEKAKVIYRAAGLKTADWVALGSGDDYSVDEIVKKIGEKSVVKPSREGSSLGVHIVESAEELSAAIEEAFTHDDSVVIETFVNGTETTVPVLGNDKPVVLPVIEIVPQAEFYDFEVKYAVGGAEHVIPARLDAPVTAAAQEAALRAHNALGCRGVSRTDIIVDDKGECWILETNTIPGMTATSLLPDAAAHVGIPFGTLCRKLVELALEEHA